MRLRFTLSLAMLVSVSAAAPTPRHCGSSLRVQLFGDSTTAGVDGSLGRIGEATPRDLLQAELDARFGVGAVSVEDRSVSGSSSGELLRGLDGRNPAWPSGVDATIVVVNHGINDAKFSVPLSTYAGNLAAMANINARVILQTPLPISGRAFETSAYADTVRRFAMDRGFGMADANRYVTGLADRAVMPDGVHPSAALYRDLNANVLAPAVVKAIHSTGCLHDVGNG